MSTVTVLIDGAPVERDAVRAWEAERAGAVLKALQRKLGVRQPAPAATTLEGRRAQIAQLRRPLGRDDVRRLWHREIGWSALSTRLASALSGKRRRIALTEIHVAGIDVHLLSRMLDALMLEDTPAHEALNLAACPDHHLLQPQGQVLEVVETTGGAPFPNRFFLDYADESGLTLPRDAAFTHQSAGTARLASGHVVGGVRHQFRAEGNGVLARLAVEFPAAVPGFMVRQHQWHLACEFSNWFGAITSL